MANTLLLESSMVTINSSNSPFLQSTPLLRPYPIRFVSLPPLIRPLTSLKSHKPSKFTLRCDAKTPNSPNSELCIKKKAPNPIRFVLDAISSALRALKKPAIVAVFVGLLLMYDPNSAWAASGGRMGGRSFSSRSSTSSSRGYSLGSSSPSRGFSESVPYYAPSPFGFGGGGFYVAPVFGIGVGGASLFLILMGFAAFMLVSELLSDRTEDGVLTATEKTSVIKLQVGLLGMARSLQSDLNRIAESADTSTPEGLSYVLTETVLALLRHPDYCISAYSSVDVKRSIEEGEKRFNQLSIEERGKFDEETLVNVNNIKRQSTKTMRSTGFTNEYIVITILVAAEGVHKLPAITNSLDLKEALQKLASVPSKKIMAVEVLWTPQNENDTLTERELLQDYPLLRPL